MSWRSFIAGMAAVVVVFALLFAGIHASTKGTHRPEGTAERWLAAISDTTRKGVRADAVKRANEQGDVSIGDGLVSAAAAKDGKRSFRDLEVGKATVTGNAARVPYLLHQYVSSGTAPERTGAVLLQRVDAGWRVVGRSDRRPDEKVPSEGGAPPSSAPASYWVAALLIGVVIAVVCSALIELAGRAAARGAGSGAATTA